MESKCITNKILFILQKVGTCAIAEKISQSNLSKTIIISPKSFAWICQTKSEEKFEILLRFKENYFLFQKRESHVEESYKSK